MTGYKDTVIGAIPAEWDIKTIDDIKAEGKKSIISGPFGSNISSKFFVEKGIPVIRGNNLSLDIGTRFNDEGFVYITEEKAKELNTWAEKDDLIFTAAGTIGQVGILTGNEEYPKYVISNKQLRVSLNKKLVDPLFAYYWFASPSMVDRIIQRDTGSTIPLINLTVLKSLPIPTPPPLEQQAIAATLCSLDDKIDLLHSQNKTLEALADTLFRKWFVEETEESQIGTIDEEFTFVMGQSPPGSSFNEEGSGVLFFQGRTDFGFRFPEPRVYTTEPNRMAEKFDTLVSVRAPVGDMNMAIDKCCLGRGVAAFRHKHFPHYSSYTYYKLRSLMSQIKQFEDSGTVFGAIGKDEFRKLENRIPEPGLVEKFQAAVSSFDDKIYQNTLQIQTLTRLRDTLLPKLMCGEIRVTI